MRTRYDNRSPRLLPQCRIYVLVVLHSRRAASSSDKECCCLYKVVVDVAVVTPVVSTSQNIPQIDYEDMMEYNLELQRPFFMPAEPPKIS